MNLNTKKCLVIGASSGIGEALARELAGKGCPVALVARRESELARVADDINRIAGRELAQIYVADVTDYANAPILLQHIAEEMGGLDVVIYSSGVMPMIQPTEYDFDKDRQIIEINVLGAVAWLNAAAERFDKAKSGVLVGIGSVAGDRGRRGFPVYNASKAFLETYLEALRNRLGRSGVLVTTIKPGMIATPMTAGMKVPFPIAPAPDTARAIIRAVEDGELVFYTPGFWRLVMLAIKLVPSPLMQKLNF